MIELVDVGVPSLWGHFKDGVLEACVELCWKKRWRISKADTWCLLDDMKEAISRKKDAH